MSAFNLQQSYSVISDERMSCARVKTTQNDDGLTHPESTGYHDIEYIPGIGDHRILL
jgi:hypothetical protein